MEEIEIYFPELTTIQTHQLKELGKLYKDWNEKINVISRKNIDNLYTHHVLHSLSVAKFIDFQSGSHILDIGTGGGFPGIPLAIYFPEVQFDMVDSIGKKIKVVNEVIESLQLLNAKGFHQRAEKIKGNYDFAVTRAVAPMQTLVNWSKNQINKKQQNTIPNGLIALKGGDLKEELKPFKSKVEVIPISQYFSDSFFETKKIVYLPL